MNTFSVILKFNYVKVITYPDFPAQTSDVFRLAP